MAGSVSTMSSTLPSQFAWGMRNLQVLVAKVLVFAVVFLSGADFRGDVGEDDFVIHWQIYLRLLIAFCAGLAGLLWLFPKTYREFLYWPGFLMAFYIIWYAITVIFSVEPKYSLAAWASMTGVILFVPAALRILGGWGFLRAVGTSTLIYLLGSWVAYLFFPEIGVFQEKITSTAVFERMGGLGHPNELGFYSMYTILIWAALANAGQVSKSSAWLVLAFAALTLFWCYSRTSIVLCGLGLFVSYQRRWREPRWLITGMAVLLCTWVAAFLLLGSGKLDWILEDTALRITKSGSKDELTSATGRTDIWVYGLQKIAESPTIGYGYCTGRFVMEKHSFHCHNMVLNAALYGGVLAGILMAALLLYFCFQIVVHPRPEIDGLAAAFVVGGMVEELVGAASPNAALVIFVTLLFWRQMIPQPDIHRPLTKAAVG